MNPIYERAADDPLRQRYEALVSGVGPRKALIILDEDGDLLDANPVFLIGLYWIWGLYTSGGDPPPRPPYSS